MGNNLSGIAPSQVFPIEYYLNDYKDLEFDSNLGSTRFMKVARIKTYEGYAVVKVFAIHDHSLPLANYKDKIDEIRTQLSSSFNCLSFRRLELSSKCGLLIREYAKYNLYDRMSTRPFLTHIEKLWFTFQILNALNQCHRLNVCHGDLKMENILITSWNLLLLSDFASYKPTLLPEDNPADYSYFFDTSRRDNCCIAPERFVRAIQSQCDHVAMATAAATASKLSSTTTTTAAATFSVTSDLYSKGKLTPAMDIFSAGCVLIELWSDGRSPFNLSKLLAYKTGDYDPSIVIAEIPNETIRDLVRNMIDRDPARRKKAEFYLDQERGKLFPAYFYKFLQAYMAFFSTAQILTCDEKIAGLCNDIESITKEVSDTSNEGSLLIITMITSCVRGLHHSTSKVSALQILDYIAKFSTKDSILDRIIPYVLELLRDTVAKVRAAAIETLRGCLDSIGDRISIADTNIFPEYILPELSQLINDKSSLVKRTFAAEIGSFVRIAVRFLEPTSSALSSSSPAAAATAAGHARVPLCCSKCTFNYTKEVHAVRSMFEQLFLALMTNKDAVIKRVLVASSIADMCKFFSKQKINDVILSHMITFLNDKKCPELRKSFFEHIATVASFIGRQCSLILYPLFQQGLADNLEFVVVECIKSMTDMAAKNLLNQIVLIDLLKEAMNYLIHPNIWIKHAVALFLAAAASKISELDLVCKILPHLRQFLRNDILQIERTDILMSCLIDEIPRSVYDGLLKCSNFEAVLADYANESKQSKEIARLKSDGLDDEVFRKIILVQNQFLKIRQLKFSEKSQVATSHAAVISLPASDNDLSNVAILSSPKTDSIYSNGTNKSRVIATGDMISERLKNTKLDQELRLDVGAAEKDSDSNRLAVPVASNSASTSSIHFRSFVQYEMAECRNNLNKLIEFQQNLYRDALKYEEWSAGEQDLLLETLDLPPNSHQSTSATATSPAIAAATAAATSSTTTTTSADPPTVTISATSSAAASGLGGETPAAKSNPRSDCTLRGVFVNQMHEHTDSINCLAKLKTTDLFASCSDDGRILVWDAAKMNGLCSECRSQQRFTNPESRPLISLSSNNFGQLLGTSSNDGNLYVLRVLNDSSKLKIEYRKLVSEENDGFVTETQFLDSMSANVLVYTTLYGGICGWDLRSQNLAFRLQSGLKDGIVTGFCTGNHQSWLAVGTSRGRHVVWDLRFQLPIAKIVHPKETTIRKLIRHPTDQSRLMSAVDGHNEISIWNLEMGIRDHVFWASTDPPLTYSNESSVSSSSYISAMYSDRNEKNAFVIAAGTDQKIRYWNLTKPELSRVLVASGTEKPHSHPHTVRYQQSLIDGICVVREHLTSKRHPLSRSPTKPIGPGSPTSTATASAKSAVFLNDPPKSCLDPVSPGHRDWITSVVLSASKKHQYLISADRSGVLKVWK